MNQLLFYLRRLFSFPLSIVNSVRERVAGIRGQTERGRAFWLGLPAILVAVLGVSALCWAQFGFASSLEDRYQTASQDMKQERDRLKKTLMEESRMIRVANREEVDQSDPFGGIPEDSERRKRFEQLLDEQQVYLEKLIALNPEEPEYRFQLALVSLEQGDAQRGMAIIQNLAPASEPGYATAHFWLANYLVQLAARASDQRTRLQSMSLALKHAEHCLIRDQGQLDAKRMKAMLLEQLGRREAAYATYEELFDTEVAYYERLVALNERLKREDRSQPILDRALAEFRNRLSRSGGGSGDEGQLSTEEWVRTWMHVTKCRVKLGDFDDAVSSLQNELNSLEGSQKDNAKRVFLSQLIAEVYLGQLNEIDRSEGRDAKAIFRDELELFKLAKKYSPRSPVVLKGLARISFCDYPDLAAEARSLYVPEEDDDAPADVLNELGSNALARGQYRDASRYFELANKKSPKNPFILNNLAYTYLVRDDANPARALKLIDEALRYLPAGEARMQVRSNFYDTRGTALMQLGRLTEAIAAFEIAIQDRPDKREILESLIKCYEDSNLSPEVYVKRLEALDEKESNANQN